MTNQHDACTLCERAIAYLKVRETGDGSALQLSAADSPVLRDLDGDIDCGLLVAYVVDADDRFVVLQQRHLDAAGLTADELHAIGLANLAAVANEHLRVARHGAIHAALAGGNFEASLLLLDDLWDRALRQFVTGDYLVAIPARDVLAFGPRDAPALEELRAVIDRLRGPEVDHKLLDVVLERVDGRWRRFAPSAS